MDIARQKGRVYEEEIIFSAAEYEEDKFIYKAVRGSSDLFE